MLSQLFKKEFTIDQAIIGSGEPKADIQNEAFPKVLVQFNTSSPNAVQHVWTLPSEFVLNLYAWMIEMEADEAVTDEHLEGLKEGVDQILGQVRAVLDGEGLSYELTDMQLSVVESTEAIDLSQLADDGAAAAYTIEADSNSYSVNHYLFTDFSAAVEEADSGLSDAEIDKMLNGDGSDSPTHVNDEFNEEVDVQQVEFGDFSDNGNGASGQPRNINMLLDVDLEVLVELGRKTMLIKEVLKLGKGSIVELDKAAGEPLGIFVNGRKLAEGEVVVVDDHFGIRITQLAGAAERIKSLG